MSSLLQNPNTNFGSSSSSSRRSGSGGCKAVFGSIVHSLSFGELEIIEEGAIVFDKTTGMISDVIKCSLEEFQSSSIIENFDEDFCDFSGKLIIPGFVDAHCHAPQYVFTGTGMDLPLLQWLEKYTFPCESKFQDDDFARIGYEKSIKRHLKCGTTFASYFGTLHTSACEILVDVIQQVGQRAYVGKVSMDRNSPDFYIEESSDGCLNAEKFVRHVLEQSEVGIDFLKQVDEKYPPAKRKNSSGDDSPPMTTMSSRMSFDDEEGPAIVTAAKEDVDSLLDKPNTPLIMPVVTPRFVPTCTPGMMQFLGDMSFKYGLPVQSHMSESVNEIEWVKSLHPDQESYAEVYETYNLLHSRAMMAHCCHSSDEEIEVLKRSGSGVVHCANSNFMLSSGIMDVRRFLSEGISVALGTDVAGGYSPSMLDAIRQTLIASQAKSFQHKVVDESVVGSNKAEGYVPLNYREAFHLATMGGAKVMGMQSVIGNFVPGKKMDCLVIDANAPGTPIDLFEGEGVSEMFQKFLFNGDDRNIDTVFVDGNIVLKDVEYISPQSRS